MNKPAPKIAGRPLVALAWLLKSKPFGAPLRRTLGSLVIEPALANIDFQAEGNPAPLYMPPLYKAATGARDMRENATPGPGETSESREKS
jgi:hypothetical protein